MKNIFTILLVGFFVISCSRTENNPTPPTNDSLITKMNANILYGYLPSNNQTENFINFEYDTNQRLTKKIGGILPFPPSTGLIGTFTNKIYTSLIYSNNNVVVEDFSSSSDFNVNKNTKYFMLNTLNQIDTKEIPNNNMYWLKKEKYFYTNGRISEIKTEFPNMSYDPTDPNDYLLTYSEKFYFDSNGNLNKTEYVEQQNGISKGEKIVRTFENYDNSFNPFKRMYLLDEFFYRSLSKNNYRKYTEVRYNYDVLTSSKTFAWDFKYDSNGQIVVE